MAITIRISAAAMHRQLDQMPHVMFGGIVHEPALRLADRLAALMPGDLDHVFFRIRFGRCRCSAKDDYPILAE